MTQKAKTIQPADKVVQSLQRLRDELFLRCEDTTAREIFFKINSCLYSEYPRASDTNTPKEV